MLKNIFYTVLTLGTVIVIGMTSFDSTGIFTTNNTAVEAKTLFTEIRSTGSLGEMDDVKEAGTENQAVKRLPKRSWYKMNSIWYKMTSQKNYPFSLLHQELQSEHEHVQDSNYMESI